MNLITQNELTMSSREIAELTGKNHGHVLRDIKTMIADLLKDNPKMDHDINRSVTYVYDNRNYVREAHLSKKYIECLLTGYSAQLRMKVIERMHELESKIAVPKTLPEALRLAAQAIEENIQLNEKIALDAPKVAFVDKFVDVGTTKTIREVAKILGIPEQKLISMMKEDKIIYKQSGVNLPHAYHEKKGYFEVKTGDTNGHAYTQTRVTTKGLAYLAKRYTNHAMVA